MFKKQGLQGRYTLIFATLILGVVLVLAGTLLYYFRLAMNNASVASAETLEEAVHTQLRKDGLRLTSLLANNLVNPLYNYDLGAIYRRLRNVRQQPDVLYTYVFDVNGNIVHDGFEDIPRFGEEMEDTLAVAATNAREALLQETDAVLDVTVPLFIEAQRLGGVRVGYSLEPLRQGLAKLQQKAEGIDNRHLRSQLIAILVITALLLLVAISLAAVVTRGLTRPIRKLAEAATRVGDGQEGGALDIQRDDELGELALSFSRMECNLRRTTISRDYLDSVIASLNDALFVCRENGQISMVNRAACRMLGYSEGELHGWALGELLHKDYARSLDGVEHALRRKDGSTFPVALSFSPMEDGERKSLLYVAQDISERVEQERALRLAASVYEASSDGLMITDPQGLVLKVNPAFYRVTGYEEARVVGKHISSLSFESSAGCCDMGSLVSRTREQGCWQGEVWFKRSQDEPILVWLNLMAIWNEQGQLDHYAGFITDLTQLRQAEDRIHHLAYYDALTCLPNRMLFRDRLEQALQQAQRNETRLGLLYLDLDRFKNINDTKGHQVGDELLKVVANRLQQAVRKEDTIARLGGDEFAIICPGLHWEDDAATIANKVLAAFARPFQTELYELHTSTSIGISIFPSDADDVESLLKNADAAMYRSKEQGRNSYQFFTPDMNARVHEHMAMEEGLRRALENHEFELYYQGQFDIGTGALAGMEALLRWQHPQEGSIPPARFIPVAEDSGLILPIGSRVLELLCKQLRLWQANGLQSVRAAMNLSPRQFRDPGLLQAMETTLQENGIEPHLLEVEITESVLMDDLDSSIATLMHLHKMGVRIAIDDFGKGYSSLSYLKRFPIDKLKIDRSFIHELPGDEEDAAITTAIIAMARSLKLKVLAEGVETPQQMRFLSDSGCDEIQGIYLGRPVPAAEFEKLLQPMK